jgi:hypothetical protein
MATSVDDMFGGPYTGLISYTKGDNSSYTAGVQNQFVIGSSYTAVLGGTTTFAGPLNSSLTLGTNFTGTLGNTINMSLGPSFTATEGPSVTVQASSRQQASEFVEIAAGYSEKDKTERKSFITGLSVALGVMLAAQAAANLALSARMADTATKVSSDSDTQGASKPVVGQKTSVASEMGWVGALGGANLVIAVLCGAVIKKLDTLYGNMEHCTNVKVHQKYVEMDAELGTSKSFLAITEKTMKLQRGVSKTSGSDIEFSDTDLTSRNADLKNYSKSVLTKKVATISVGTTTGKEVEDATRKEKLLTWENDADQWFVKLTADTGIELKGKNADDGNLSLASKSAKLVVGDSNMEMTDQKLSLSAGKGSQKNSISLETTGISITYAGAAFKISNGVINVGNELKIVTV